MTIGGDHEGFGFAEWSPDAVIVEDVDGCVVAFNTLAEQLFGYAADEVIGRRSADILFLPGDDGGAPAGERICRRKDGSHFVGDLRARRVVLQNGAHLIAAVRDLSRQKAVEAQLKEDSRIKSASVAYAAHELRTPLNAIVGFGQLLADGDVEYGSAQHREILGYVLSCGWHLLGLVNDILDLSRMESGRIVYRPEPVADVTRLIGTVVTMLAPVARAKAIDVRVDVHPSAARAVIDPARLKQVVCNYLSNALKFTGRGGKVCIRMRAEGAQYLRLEVEDNGSGLRPQDAATVFDESSRLDSPSGRRRAGAGLGLSLMKRLVEGQGGTVGVRSLPDQGSAFFATFVNHQAPAASPLTPPPYATASDEDGEQDGDQGGDDEDGDRGGTFPLVSW
ncbi:MAG TPA: PAS domain-containing sensor histidine kinase [Polyangia bacterium]